MNKDEDILIKNRKDQSEIFIKDDYIKQLDKMRNDEALLFKYGDWNILRKD